MMTPLRRATAGGDQEKFTCLCPATATNISGAPSGTENSKTINVHIASLLSNSGANYIVLPVSAVVGVSVRSFEDPTGLTVTILQL